MLQADEEDEDDEDKMCSPDKIYYGSDSDESFFAEYKQYKRLVRGKQELERRNKQKRDKFKYASSNEDEYYDEEMEEEKAEEELT